MVGQPVCEQRCNTMTPPRIDSVLDPNPPERIIPDALAFSHGFVAIIDADPSGVFHGGPYAGSLPEALEGAGLVRYVARSLDQAIEGIANLERLCAWKKVDTIVIHGLERLVADAPDSRADYDDIRSAAVQIASRHGATVIMSPAWSTDPMAVDEEVRRTRAGAGRAKKEKPRAPRKSAHSHHVELV